MLVALALVATITFDAPADVAFRLVPKLGVAAGLRLETDAQAGRQVLLINVKGMKRDRLLHLVLEATGAVWEPIDGGFRLTLGGDRLRTLVKEESERRQVWIAAEAEKKRASPLGRAMALVGSAALAGLGPGERIVWSTDPTRLQRPLPQSARLGDALAKAEVQRLQTLQQDHPEIQALDDEAERVRSPVATTILAARRGLDSTTISVRLSAFDEQGGILATQEIGLIPPDSPIVALSQADDFKTLNLPPDFRAWEKPRLPGVLDAMTSARVLAGLTHPEAHEPLAFGAAPAVASIAEGLGHDVVADLPDRAFQAAEEGARTRFPVGNWLRLLQVCGMASQFDGRTLVVRPDDLAMAAVRRTDRIDLRRRIASLETHGNVALDFPVGTAFEDAYLGGLPLHRWDINENADLTRRAGQAWLSLNPAQQDAAQHGGVSVPLDAPFWSLIRDLVVQPERPLESVPRLGLAFEPTFFLAASDPRLGVIASYEETSAAVLQEPGEAFPLAVPDLLRAAQAIASKKIGSPFLQARFWPAMHRHLKLNLILNKIQMWYSVDETMREPGSGTRLPNVFPALREVLDRL